MRSCEEADLEALADLPVAEPGTASAESPAVPQEAVAAALSASFGSFQKVAAEELNARNAPLDSDQLELMALPREAYSNQEAEVDVPSGIGIFTDAEDSVAATAVKQDQESAQRQLLLRRLEQVALVHLACGRVAGVSGSPSSGISHISKAASRSTIVDASPWMPNAKLWHAMSSRPCLTRWSKRSTNVGLSKPIFWQRQAPKAGGLAAALLSQSPPRERSTRE
jgi:hypothetical protein